MGLLVVGVRAIRAPPAVIGASLSRASAPTIGAALIAALAASSAAAQTPPSVASINLCADQLVLVLADPGQIVTVSWLAADPEESMLAEAAARYPLNYGSAEELLRYDPDVVIAGEYTTPFTRLQLERLGYDVVTIVPETTIADIERNLRIVGRALAREARAERQVAELRERVRASAARKPGQPLAAVVVRPGGFTVASDSLAHDLMMLAGVRNVAAEQGLDRWGSLSMETLVRSSPDLLVFSNYHASEPSLANTVLEHPALVRLGVRHRSVIVPARLSSCGLPQSLESVALLQEAAARR
jgi:iron complex transport system substrate-binding protein